MRSEPFSDHCKALASVVDAPTCTSRFGGYCRLRDRRLFSDFAPVKLCESKVRRCDRPKLRNYSGRGDCRVQDG